MAFLFLSVAPFGLPVFPETCINSGFEKENVEVEEREGERQGEVAEVAEASEADTEVASIFLS